MVKFLDIPEDVVKHVILPWRRQICYYDKRENDSKKVLIDIYRRKGYFYSKSDLTYKNLIYLASINFDCVNSSDRLLYYSINKFNCASLSIFIKRHYYNIDKVLTDIEPLKETYESYYDSKPFYDYDKNYHRFFRDNNNKCPIIL